VSAYNIPVIPASHSKILALAATVLHCAMSEYASGKKATLMISQDEYQGTLCPSPVIHFTLGAAALLNYTFLGWIRPPLPTLQFNSARKGTTQSVRAVLRFD